MKSIETVIIGAGPYGLSIAAHLKAAKRPYHLYGTPLESWSSFMPEGMFLRSEPFASNLWDPRRRYTFKRYCAHKNLPYQDFGKPVSLEIFLEYAEWFRSQAVGEVLDIRITRARQSAKGFVVELANGDQVECRNLILATGHMEFRSVPGEVAALPESLCLHTARLRDVKKYAGRDVTVVGAGQSALESAALIHEAGAKVRILVRKDFVKWNAPSTKMGRSLWARIKKPEAGLGGGWSILAIAELPRIFHWMFSAEKRHRFVKTSWGASGSRWLRERIENKVEVMTGHHIREAKESGGRIRLQIQGPNGVKELVTDHVIAGTGFKIDLTRLSYLDPELRGKIALERETAPAMNSRYETSVPRLFIVGIATSLNYGPVMRFMFGAKHAAPVITRRIRGW